MVHLVDRSLFGQRLLTFARQLARQRLTLFLECVQLRRQVGQVLFLGFALCMRRRRTKTHRQSVRLEAHAAHKQTKNKNANSAVTQLSFILRSSLCFVSSTFVSILMFSAFDQRHRQRDAAQRRTTRHERAKRYEQYFQKIVTDKKIGRTRANTSGAPFS